MPSECSLCRRPEAERTAIGTALVERSESLRDIAARFGTSTSSLVRHREHLPRALAQATRARDIAVADTVLGKVEGLELDAKRIGQAAEDAGDLRTALASIGQLVKIVELLAKLTGELKSGPAVEVNVNAGVLALVQQHKVTEDEVSTIVQLRDWEGLPREERRRLLQIEIDSLDKEAE